MSASQIAKKMADPFPQSIPNSICTAASADLSPESNLNNPDMCFKANNNYAGAAIAGTIMISSESKIIAVCKKILDGRSKINMKESG